MEYNYQHYQKKKKKRRFWLWLLIILFLGIGSLFFVKTSSTISQIIGRDDHIIAQELPIKEPPKLPEKDENRINILLLGMRGIDEPGEGQLLSDSIVILSIQKDTNKTAIISIPRDLYVEIWGLWEKRKINFAYAHGGFDCVKKTVALATNQHIDHAVSINFRAFKNFIDILGGVTVYLNKPFEEPMQWAQEGEEENDFWIKKEIDGEEKWVFHVPAGASLLNGSTTLYYVRSRFSTSDFDRMWRQQQVMMAVKNKVLSLGVLANPVKLYNILDLLGKNVRTDMSLGDIKDMIKLVSDLDTENINKVIFDTTEEGLLYETFVNEEYVLLPIDDNFGNIWRACKEVF